MVKNVRIGSDPEFFIRNNNGKFISSIGIIPGVKNSAVQMKGLPDGFKSQIDNVLGEFNIPPVTSRQDLIDNMQKAKDWFNDFLHAKGLHVYNAASAVYEEDQLQTKESQEIGCDPDINCWTEQWNHKPEEYFSGLRTSGCHFHIGYDEPNVDDNFDLMCACDIMLGVPSILIDTDTERRQYYGKAGSFRHQKWGAEYRVLSGYFLSSPKLVGWCYDQLMRAVELVNSGQKLSPFGYDVQQIINENEVERAKEFCKQWQIELP